MSTKPIALAGIGKIARDEHLPALEASPDWHLAATISRNSSVDGVRAYEDIDDFLADPDGIETVSLALPPAPRFEYAVKAMRAGLNVMIEKPPAVTLTQARQLIHEAELADVSLYVTWHSRMGAAVEEARRRLKGADLKRVSIDWREDVREHHPGQEWVFEAGNFGVFDPGINAFSILVEILDRPVFVEKAHMVVPEGRETPITADLSFHDPKGAKVECALDWRYEDTAIWNMEIETAEQTFTLTRSGTAIDDGNGEIALEGETDEYALLYAHMARLVEQGRSDIDLRPMEHVADAFMLGTWETGKPFSF